MKDEHKARLSLSPPPQAKGMTSVTRGWIFFRNNQMQGENFHRSS